MHLHSYLALLAGAEQTLAVSYRRVAAGHRADADVAYLSVAFAGRCEAHAAALAPVCDRYLASAEPEPERLHVSGLGPARTGPIGLLRDLADLYQLATFVASTWDLVGQAAHGARDRALIGCVSDCEPEINAQLAWLRTRMKAEAPQALLVASSPAPSGPVVERNRSTNDA